MCALDNILMMLVSSEVFGPVWFFHKTLSSQPEDKSAGQQTPIHLEDKSAFDVSETKLLFCRRHGA